MERRPTEQYWSNQREGNPNDRIRAPPGEAPLFRTQRLNHLHMLKNAKRLQSVPLSIAGTAGWKFFRLICLPGLSAERALNERYTLKRFTNGILFFSKWAQEAAGRRRSTILTVLENVA